MTDAVVASSVAKDFAKRLGWPTKAVACFALAAGELASNCWRHGGGGHIELSSCDEVLEVRAIDSGPGIDDLQLAQEDRVSGGHRHSLANPLRHCLGSGLGSVYRLMDEVEVQSDRSTGTTVVARKHLRDPGP